MALQFAFLQLLIVRSTVEFNGCHSWISGILDGWMGIELLPTLAILSYIHFACDIASRKCYSADCHCCVLDVPVIPVVWYRSIPGSLVVPR